MTIKYVFFNSLFFQIVIKSCWEICCLNNTEVNRQRGFLGHRLIPLTSNAPTDELSHVSWPAPHLSFLSTTINQHCQKKKGVYIRMSTGKEFKILFSFKTFWHNLHTILFFFKNISQSADMIWSYFNLWDNFGIWNWIERKLNNFRQM